MNAHLLSLLNIPFIVLYIPFIVLCIYGMLYIIYTYTGIRDSGHIQLQLYRTYRQIYVNWAATLRNFTPRQLGTWQNKGHSRTQLELVIGPMNLFLKIQIFKRSTTAAKSQFFAPCDEDRGSYRIWIWILTTFFSEILWSYHFITTLGLSLAPLVISISVQLNNDF